MNVLTARLLRLVIVLMVVGVLFTQVLVLPDTARTLTDHYPEAAHLSTPTLVTSIIGLATAQLALVCVWRLVTLVRRDAVFSPGAFRWVDLIIGAAAAAGALAFGLLVWLTVQTAETGLQPGIALVLLACSVLAAGVALLVGVLRSLLAKAVGLKGEATILRAELAEVI